MNGTTHLNPRIAASAERQMQAWSRLQEVAARAEKAAEFPMRLGRGIGYVTISREAGAAGTTVARLVGERLQWDVYDRNLLDELAHRYKESRLMLDLVDETEGNWVFDVLGASIDRNIITHEKYMVQMSRMIQLLAKDGNAVFVGRASQFLLPRQKTLAVRIIATEEYRSERVMRRRNIDRSEAVQVIRQTDRGRSEFVKKYYRQEIEDPHLYDMLLNIERLGPSIAADQIVRAVQQVA